MTKDEAAIFERELRMADVPVPPGGLGGIVDREALAATEPRAREVWLALAKGEFGRARQVVAQCERERLVASLVDGRTPLAEICGRAAKVTNLLETHAGVITVADLVETPAMTLLAAPHVGSWSLVDLLQQVLRLLVRVEEE